MAGDDVAVGFGFGGVDAELELEAPSSGLSSHCHKRKAQNMGGFENVDLCSHHCNHHFCKNLQKMTNFE